MRVDAGRLQASLEPGESVLWSGRPDLLRAAWRRVLHAAALGLLAGLLFGLVLALGDLLRRAQAPADALSGWPQAVTLAAGAVPWDLVAKLALLVAVPVLAVDLLLALGRLYAITDRAFVWLGWWRRKPRRIALAEAAHLAVRYHPGGTATLYFARAPRLSFDWIADADQAIAGARQAGQLAAGWEPAPYRRGIGSQISGCLTLLFVGIALVVAMTGQPADLSRSRSPLVLALLAGAFCLLAYAGVWLMYRSQGLSGWATRLAAVGGAIMLVAAMLLLVPVSSALLRERVETRRTEQLTVDPADDRYPEWSPDGQRLAFASRRSGDWDIYVLEVGEGEPRLLVDAGGSDQAPAWSPDGDKIAFVSLAGDSRGNTVERIYAVRDDGSDLTLMWPDLGSRWPRQGVTLSWSPEGHSLFGGGEVVYELALDGLLAVEERRVMAAAYTPALSPDGLRLAFAALRDEELSDIDIYVADLEGGQRFNLTWPVAGGSRTPGDNHDPAWSPDGRRIAFVDGQDMLYLVEVAQAGAGAGAELEWLGRGQDPAWSPDGRTIAFSALHDGQWDIYLMEADAGAGDGELDPRALALLVAAGLLVLASGRWAGFSLLLTLGGALVGATMGHSGGMVPLVEQASWGALWGALAGYLLGWLLWAAMAGLVARRAARSRVP